MKKDENKGEKKTTKNAISEIFELGKQPNPEELEPMVDSWGRRMKPKPKKK